MSFSIPTLKAYQMILSTCPYTYGISSSYFLLHGESIPIIDSSSTGWTVTNTNVTINSNTSLPVKFCNDMYFNGTNAYLTLQANMLTATSTYTVEGWFYISSNSVTIMSPNTGLNGIGLFIDSNGYIWLTDNISSGSSSSPSVISTGVWHHIALVADGSNFNSKLYVDGNLFKTYLNAYSFTSLNTTQMNIGKATSFGPSAGFFNGYIDEFRLSNSIIYTGNFTPPSIPFT